METRSLMDLITDLRQRRIAGEAPPVLFLGAGASVEAGIGAMAEVYKFFGVPDFDTFVKRIETYTPTNVTETFISSFRLVTLPRSRSGMPRWPPSAPRPISIWS
jgi:hypothetical protein